MSKTPVDLDEVMSGGRNSTRKKLSLSQQINSQNQRLGRILEDSYNEIYMVDPRTMRFVWVNRGARVNLGYTVEELSHMTPADISEDTLEGIYERAKPLVYGEKRMLSFEGVHLRKDGSRYPVEIRLLRAASDADATVVAIVQDISERKRNERIKDEFISIVSHELRTPLTPIIGVLDLLESDPVVTEDEHVEQLVGVARRNALRLRRLIDQLLDYRDLSQGDASFDLRNLELGDVILASIHACRYLHQRYDFELNLQLASEELWVLADRGYMVQLMSILLSNAAKFSPVGAEVTVATETHDSHALISISDCGPGIPEEMRAHIFDQFVQADSTATRRYGGTGIGLSLAQLIVEQFDGRIFFECGEEAGTTFYVELPLCESAADLID
ncbi:PAS domain S-box protein [Persicimonas caeni]|uniref:histidine kinase n=1 Tax=Persicimonas caeni TaxID=2292766 RepID=A0A4Y6PV11_PERCE|nr:PAS domain-containing sensor histidine kinase [Persicimonas caeni]QDG51949.1 PAS domain S-box protein [Persicimonas caeni]QED33170.1 PAS domain S-box protein [Persicimonas caeni]